MRWFEQHANGAAINIRGSRRYVDAKIAEWREAQLMPEYQPEQGPQGADSHTQLAEPHVDQRFYGYPMSVPTQRIGFSA